MPLKEDGSLIVSLQPGDGKEETTKSGSGDEMVRPTGPTLIRSDLGGAMLRRDDATPAFATDVPYHIDRRTPLGGLINIAGKDVRRVVGLMSGTSLDGIDLAEVEISGDYPRIKVKLLRFASYPFPADLRKEALELITPFIPPRSLKEKWSLIWRLIKEVRRGTLDLGHTPTLKMIARLDFLIGEAFAGVINEFRADNEIPQDEIDLIATAGQTIWHAPEQMEFFTDWPPYHIKTRATFALGQSAVIAERTGICTIGDLRVRDVAAGGHGAPLIPYADFVLLQDRTMARCIQNIGGVGNVSWVPSEPAGVEQVIAYDTGPGNMIIDGLAGIATAGAQKFDENSLLAMRGSVREDILEALMQHPFILQDRPKTTGREMFGVQFAQQLVRDNPKVPIYDLIATATRFTARSIAQSYQRFLISPGHRIDEVIVGGGGGNNPLLMSMLREETGLPVYSHEDIGFLSQAKEPMAMAIIADSAARGLVTNVPGATGGNPTPLGKINLGTGIPS
jgi:anhydro-N-acetylmuramic acid kinase